MTRLSLRHTSDDAVAMGYRIKITRVEWFAFYSAGHEWRVDVTRISDGQVLSRTFSWHWMARRFARSTGRLGRAFGRAKRRRDDEIETFTIGWRDDA